MCQLTASRAGTSVTSLLGLLVATLAKVISTGVDDQSTLIYWVSICLDHATPILLVLVVLIVCSSIVQLELVCGMELTYAQNALGTDQLDKLVLSGTNSIALSIGLEVTKVTDVTVGVSGSTVGLAVGVDYDLVRIWSSSSC